MPAVLSDIHANLEALEAVLADLAYRQVDAVHCLGDTLGYGPDPVACLDRVMGFDVVLLGELDLAVLHEPDAYPEGLLRTVRFHRRELEAADAGHGRYHQFLMGRPRSYIENDVRFVHGSPHNPLSGFVFPEDVHNPRKMTRVGERMDRVCFCGHTHVPGVFVERGPGDWLFHAPPEFNHIWRPDGRKTLVNVGSVGQPRDGDPRAGYVLFDGEAVRFVRLPYDVATTIREVRRSPDIDDLHGDRLGEGH